MLLNKKILEEIVDNYRNNNQNVSKQAIDSAYNSMLEKENTTSNDVSFLTYMFTRIVDTNVRLERSSND